MSSRWSTRKVVTVSIHVLVWILFFSYPHLLRPIFNNNAPASQQKLSGIYYLFFLNNLLRMILFYFNAYFLVPKLAYQKKILAYLLSLVVALAILFAGDRLFFSLFITNGAYHVWNFFVFNLPFFFFIVIVSTAYRVLWDRMEENRLRKERETENLKTELSFLRSQVSPHFMFNVLNNMVALARKKSDDLEPSLIKLSQLLRYMLYETGEDKVLLEKEVEYLQSYIDLQKQRFGKNVAIHTCFSILEKGHTIEPMLLIPFVENAFKHGTGLLTDATIEVKLAVKDGVLFFEVRNRYNGELAETKDKTSGIGLNNVRRRLELMYNQNHTLSFAKENGWFLVSLHLNLH
ncbi:sensor histidine kinase [Flavisolibacter nicotianae]|uniref:sensor histidine kinase n=1 Tax=Flavisolibacter nicotianae TaxID=2364882 RepID=UPI000EABB783|nr:histidine kinase [Flavisolibacter nicotianae]